MNRADTDRRLPAPSAPRAAVFRLEGTLSPRPTLTAAAWMSLNARRVSARVLGLSAFALAAPLSGRDPGRAARLAWSVLEGMSEDRLIVLGELYTEQYILPVLNPVGVEMLTRCRASGQRAVLVSDNLDVIVNPLARALGVDDVIANHLTLDRDARATGALRPPVFGPALLGRPLANALLERGIELRDAAAYGSAAADALLLSAAGLPCALSPDRALRRIARDLDWPVIEANGGAR